MCALRRPTGALSAVCVSMDFGEHPVAAGPEDEDLDGQRQKEAVVLIRGHVRPGAPLAGLRQ